MTVCSIKLGDRVFYTVGEYAEVVAAIVEGKALRIFETGISGKWDTEQITFFTDVEWVKTESACAIPDGWG